MKWRRPSTPLWVLCPTGAGQEGDRAGQEHLAEVEGPPTIKSQGKAVTSQLCMLINPGPVSP